jgi:hypothetical protein
MGKHTLKLLFVKVPMFSAAVALVAGIGVTITASPAAAQPLPTTNVLIPSNGATLSGPNATLDASAPNATAVDFVLFGGPYYDTDVCNAVSTYYGWYCSNWDTGNVPNGTYTLFSQASNSTGSELSSAVSITVNNPVPTTSVLVPKNNATVSGTTTLDASAPNATSVDFVLFEAPYYDNTDVCNAVSTEYGWYCSWDTTSVPNGVYTLSSVATNSVGVEAISVGVSITVNNPQTSTSVLVPKNNATVSGTTALDAPAANATDVYFYVEGGTSVDYSGTACTASATYYGWACTWNTATVPDGTYEISSYATNSNTGQAANSPAVTVTVDN